MVCAYSKEQISGPPAYLTVDWKAAKDSINRLKELNPNIVLPSHGKPMEGKEIMEHLNMLVNDFDEISKPEGGRFVDK